MYSVTFVNAENAINLTLDHLRIAGVDDKSLFLGSVDRAIDGDAIAYNGGSKKEPTISLKNLSEAEKEILKEIQIDQLEVVFTLSDAYLGATIHTFTAVFDEFSPKLDPLTRLYSAEIRVMEV
jgi:hypothetical protein